LFSESLFSDSWAKRALSALNTRPKIVPRNGGKEGRN
jgi:hypothetical protein